MLKILKKLFSSFKGQETGWIKGRTNGYKYCLKAYKQPSVLGIRGSNITALEVWKNDNLVVNYNRGWDITPDSYQLICLVNDLIMEYGIIESDACTSRVM